MSNIDQNEANEHFFEHFLTKKIRAINKKIKEIESIENLKNLKPEQLKKIESKIRHEDDINYYLEIKSLFKQAEKENLQHTKKDGSTTSPKKTEKIFDETLENSSSIKPIFDLIYLSQTYLQATLSEEHKHIKINSQSMKDLEHLYNLYSKIFSKPHGAEFLTHEELEKRYGQLHSFVTQEHIYAADKLFYSDLFHITQNYRDKYIIDANVLHSKHERSPEKSPVKEFKSPIKTVPKDLKSPLKIDKIDSPIKIHQSEKKEKVEIIEKKEEEPHHEKKIEQKNEEAKEKYVKKNLNYNKKYPNNLKKGSTYNKREEFEIQYVVKEN